MKKKILLVITAFLALITLVLVGNYNTRAYAVADTVVMNNGKAYEKVTDVAQVTDGNYIIGAENKESFAAIYDGKKGYKSTSNSEDAFVFNFTKAVNGFYISHEGKYLATTSTSLKEVDESAKEDVIVETYKTGFTLRFKGGTLLCNNSSPLYRIYSTSQAPLELFKEKVLSPDTKTYTVTFNTMGGNVLDSLVFMENDTLDNLPEPEKDGMLFVGWYKEETLVNEWNPLSDKLTSDITLYAKWIEAPYQTLKTLSDLDSAEYYMSVNDEFVNGCDKNTLTKINDFTQAIKFTFYEIEENKVIVEFMNNGVKTYLNTGSKADAYFTTDYNTAKVFVMDELNGQVILRGDGVRVLCENGNYVRFYEPSTQFTPITFLKVKNSSFDLNEKLFKQINTLSSLKVEYDTTTLEATDIDLRFGTIIPTNLFNANAKYGVVAVKKTSGLSLKSGLQAEQNIAEFIGKNNGSKYVEATPVDVTDGKQFAWVINNIEAQELKYNETFIACVYMEVDGKLYFANAKEASVKDVAQVYVTDSSLNIPTSVIEVLKKLV